MIVQQACYGSSYLPSPQMIWKYPTIINLTLQFGLQAWGGAQKPSDEEHTLPVFLKKEGRVWLKQSTCRKESLGTKEAT